MIPKMPRGAMPIARNELAAAEPYRVENSAETFVPSGMFPTPNHELSAAQPYRATRAAPKSFTRWPIGIGFTANDNVSNSSWAEEAFAKACTEPRVIIPAEVILTTARECGSSNFSEFMQTRGFQMDGKAYLDGPFNSIDWTNSAALHDAIAHVGPVKIGVASANLTSLPEGQITPGKNGWAIHGLLKGQPENDCASLCGYGPLPALVDLFEREGISLKLPSGMPTGLCYAIFTSASIGIIDQQSLMNITGEAWVRNPTTIVKNFGA